MNTRLYNGLICTMEHGMEVVEGELWVQGSRVAYAGPAKQTELSFDRELDLEGNLVLPGFKNAHTHSAMTFLRSYADDLPLLDWLNQKVFPMEAVLRPEQAYYLNLLAIMEYLTSGITSAFDMYFFPGEMAKAAIDAGFRTVLTGSVNDFTGSCAAMEADFDRLNNMHELVSCTMGFHAEYTCSEELLVSIAKVAERHNAPVFTHSSESKREVEECIQRTGMTPTAYMDSLGLFDRGGGCFHCVHMTAEDLAVLRERGMAVVTNPASNCKLASGIAPVQEMLDMGILVALGTDGPASNNSLDMFREMFLATALQKVRTGDATALDADSVLHMATTAGAQVMGLTNCTSLAPGKLADLVVIDLKQPNMQPINNIVKNVVYSGSKQNVKLTMVNGKILYEGGRFLIGVDPDEVYEKTNFIISSMKRR